MNLQSEVVAPGPVNRHALQVILKILTKMKCKQECMDNGIVNTRASQKKTTTRPGPLWLHVPTCDCASRANLSDAFGPWDLL
jgi:hypothetical protein